LQAFTPQTNFEGTLPPTRSDESVFYRKLDQCRRILHLKLGEQVFTVAIDPAMAGRSLS
jgi:hypothetical protein